MVYIHKKGIFKRLRNIYLKNFRWKKYKLGKNFHAGRGCQLWAKNYIEIGQGFYMGRYSQIECDAKIGDFVFFGNFVALIGKYDHNYKDIGTAIFHTPHIRNKNYNWLGLNSEIIIDDDVWVGYGSIILSGVKIGQGSIIAAGSVVTKNVEPFSIYGGNPARKICDRFDSPDDLKKHIEAYNLKYRTSK
ncbi:MAG: acyltransferase [Bacteroidales bacterium]|nr:acyltransferase [Bacteroidales bacterium]